MGPNQDDPAAFARFIRRSLLQPITEDDAGGRAAAETEIPMDGDRWFWADDNAKILSFLTTRTLAGRFAEEVVQVHDFLTSLCAGPFIFRRVGRSRFERVRLNAGVGEFITTFLRVDANLKRGIVAAGMRFHDGRTAQHVTLTGNYVQFTYRGRVITIDVEDSIVAFDVAEKPGGASLQHASELRFAHDGASVRLGRVIYTYELDSHAGCLAVEARLELDSAVEVADVVLTLGCDDLSPEDKNVNYGAVWGLRPDGSLLRIAPAAVGEQYVTSGPLGYVSAVQTEELTGFALGIHFVPENPERMVGLRITRKRGERLHWLVQEYLFSGRQTGATLVARTRVWLSAGGFYDLVPTYARLLADPALLRRAAPVDVSVSYDYGAEIEAFACCYRTAANEGAPSSFTAEWQRRNRELFDHYFEVYRDHFLVPEIGGSGAAFSRPMSFVVLGLCDMFEQTRDERYRQELISVARLLLRFGIPQTDVADQPALAFTMGSRLCRDAHVDCHSAVLLALIRSYPLTGDEDALRALELGLNALAVATTRVEFGGSSKHDLIGIDFQKPDGTRRFFDSFWNYSGGLTLRALVALRRAENTELCRIRARHRQRLDLLEMIQRAQLRQSIRVRDDALELRTSTLSAEGNSETQPWGAMGLLGDALLHSG